MNICVALSLFSVIIAVYLIITEMFTICRTFDAQESFEDQ